MVTHLAIPDGTSGLYLRTLCSNKRCTTRGNCSTNTRYTSCKICCKRIKMHSEAAQDRPTRTKRQEQRPVNDPKQYRQAHSLI